MVRRHESGAANVPVERMLDGIWGRKGTGTEVERSRSWVGVVRKDAPDVIGCVEGKPGLVPGIASDLAKAFKYARGRVEVVVRHDGSAVHH